MKRNIHILFAILLTLFSLKTHAAASSESTFYYYCDDRACPAYKAHMKNPNSDDPKWMNKLKDFAEKGEPNAIKTIVTNEKNEKKREVFLRKIAKSTSSAFPFLAGHLDNVQNPECLIWYQKCIDNFVPDPDSIINFAMAILRFSQPSLDVTDKAMALLQKWDREYMTTSKEDLLFCMAVYELIFKNAKKLEYIDLIIQHVNWNHRFSAVTEGVRRIFLQVFEGTPYINLMIKKTGLVPMLIKPEDLLNPNYILGLATKIVKKHQDYDLNVVSVIVGNLSAILQDKVIREVPNQKYKDFDANNASLEQITYWARSIVILRRKELVLYDGKDIMLKTLFSELDNVTLEKYLINAFKDMFSLEF